MIPVLTPQEMQAVDERAQREVGLSTLIERAGYAVAMQAITMLGGAYGRHVVVVAGKGHNGDDGRVAARILSRRGARVLLVDASAPPVSLPSCDLVIDAAYGTGFHGDYDAPQVVAPTPVLAVDIASGVDATTGVAGPRAVRADVTVTFGALKPGLLFHDGPAHCGKVLIVDDRPWDHFSELLHRRRQRLLATHAAPSGRAQVGRGHLGGRRVAGNARRSNSVEYRPRCAPDRGWCIWPVQGLHQDGHSSARSSKLTSTRGTTRRNCSSISSAARRSSSVRGSALRPRPSLRSQRSSPSAAGRDKLVDADGLNCLVQHGDWTTLTRKRQSTTVLTPHDGEFTRLNGAAVEDDRIVATRSLAERSGATVLLKGSTTVIANDEATDASRNSGLGAPCDRRNRRRVVGDHRRTAGAAASSRCGRQRSVRISMEGAASFGPAEGLVASDLLPLVAQWLSAVAGERQWS